MDVLANAIQAESVRLKLNRGPDSRLKILDTSLGREHSQNQKRVGTGIRGTIHAHTYIYIYVCMYVCVHIYIYTHAFVVHSKFSHMAGIGGLPA